MIRAEAVTCALAPDWGACCAAAGAPASIRVIVVKESKILRISLRKPAKPVPDKVNKRLTRPFSVLFPYKTDEASETVWERDNFGRSIKAAQPQQPRQQYLLRAYPPFATGTRLPRAYGPVRMTVRSWRNW